MPIITDINTSWICVKQIFKVEGNRIVYISWKDDESLTEIHSERKQKKIMKQAYKIPALEDNRGLSHHLIVAMLKKKLLLVD